MEDIRHQFGRRLHELRKARGLSQEELAYRASMSVPYLSDLERGRWNPSLAMIADLARALAITPSVLLAGIDAGDPMTTAGLTRRKRSKDAAP